MLTQDSFRQLCSTLYFEIRKEYNPPSLQLKDIRHVVALSFGFESDKTINQYLKNSTLIITSDFCEHFSSKVKDLFNIEFYRSPLCFKWPDNIEFSVQEINQFWRHELQRTESLIGDDLLMMMTPTMQYKKGKWIVSTESIVSKNHINRVVGKNISESGPSHTDIINKLSHKANQGDADALYEIALLHMKKQDYGLALEFLQKTLELTPKHADALSCLACVYSENIGNDPKAALKKSEETYLKASELGSAQASHALGVCYDLNGLFEEDHEKAYKYHRLAIERGNHASIDCLIAMIVYGRIPSDEFDPKFLKQLFNMGLQLQDPSTITRIADYYHNNGELTPEELFKLREMCVEINPRTENAHMELARYYQNGFGCDKNIDLAIKHFTIAAEKFNCADSMYLLATINRDELNNEAAFFDFLTQALNAINDNTMFAVTIFYVSAIQAEKNEDYNSAIDLFNKAISYSNTVIEHLNPELQCEIEKLRTSAKLNLGIIKYKCLSNHTEGLQHIYEAAHTGDIEAKYCLGVILVHDFDDIINGKAFLQEAKEHGHLKATEEYNSLLTSV